MEGDRAAEFEVELRQAQVRELFRHSLTGIVGSAAAGIIVAGLFWSAAPRALLLAWLGALLLLQAVRLFVTRRYRREADPTAAERWGARLMHLTSATGLTWGAAVVLLWPADPLLQMVLPVTLVGLSAAAAAAYSSVRTAYVPFMLLAMLPFAGRFLLEGTRAHAVLGLLALVYTGVLFRVGEAMHTASAEALAVGIRNRALAAEAQAASQAKGDFVAHVSHEIRTPMNAVIALADVALRSDPPPDIRRHLERIRTSSHALLRIVNDLLDLSRIEAGRLDLEHIAFDVEAVVGDVRQLLAETAAGKGLALDASVAPDVPRRLRGDPLRLGQVLVNLVGNAIKFTERGRVTVRVELVSAEAGRVRLRATVEDTGIGMDRESLSRIFDSFRQADESIPRRYGGSGLGLTISRRLVALMGGPLNMESEPGRGTRFWFELELTRAEEGGDTAGEARVLPPTADSLAGARVLVVDDDSINRDVAREVLATAGVAVEGASSGEEALAKVEARSYDAVLMDVQMPGLDGLETTRRLRARPAHARLPVVALTANAMTGERERCLAAGMNEYLSKPIDMTVLLSTLAGLLDRSSRAAGPAPAARAAEGGGLPGVDVPSALRRLGGNEGLLRSLLARFAVEWADAAADVRDALRAADVERARARVHAIRGVAANLSATRLTEAAATLEGALAAEGVDAGRPQVAAFESALAELVATGRALPPPAPSGPVAAGASRAEAERLISRLGALLRASHYDAVTLAESGLDVLDEWMPGNERESLRARIGAFDFPAALEIVEGVARRLRVTI